MVRDQKTMKLVIIAFSLSAMVLSTVAPTVALAEMGDRGGDREKSRPAPQAAPVTAAPQPAPVAPQPAPVAPPPQRVFAPPPQAAPPVVAQPTQPASPPVRRDRPGRQEQPGRGQVEPARRQDQPVRQVGPVLPPSVNPKRDEHNNHPIEAVHQTHRQQDSQDEERQQRQAHEQHQAHRDWDRRRHDEIIARIIELQRERAEADAARQAAIDAEIALENQQAVMAQAQAEAQAAAAASADQEQQQEVANQIRQQRYEAWLQRAPVFYAKGASNDYYLGRQASTKKIDKATKARAAAISARRQLANADKSSASDFLNGLKSSLASDRKGFAAQYGLSVSTSIRAAVAALRFNLAARYSQWYANSVRPDASSLPQTINWFQQMPDIGDWSYGDIIVVAANLESLTRDVYAEVQQPQVASLIAVAQAYSNSVISGSDTTDSLTNLLEFDGQLEKVESELSEAAQSSQSLSDELSALRYFVEELKFDYRVNY